MPCSKKGQATSSNPVANPEEDAVLNSDSREEVQDGRIVARRADLLRTRQIDLDSLMVQHDDLVCLFSSGGLFKSILILFVIFVRCARPSTWTNLSHFSIMIPRCV